MKSDLDRLYNISRKKERRIIGLMSGTSLDGLDIALVNISGSGNKVSVKLEEFVTIDYASDYKENIEKVFAKKTADLEWLCCLNPWIANHHSDMILRALNEWRIDANEIDLVASHGQTIYHAPSQQHGLKQFPNSTLQLGDGDHMAHKLGIITLSDFRQKHIAAGGEGAPLVLYGDYILFHSDQEDRIMLNLGGIANLTYLPKGESFAQSVCSDVGPGNTLLDSCSKRFFNQAFDEDARLAKKGSKSEALLSSLKSHYFFDSPKAKTTGPEVFNFEYVEKAMDAFSMSEREALSPFDIMCTLTHFTVWGISHYLNINHVDTESCSLYLSGGGAHNPLLVELLQTELNNNKVYSSEELGINPDAKEAILFALLANECIAGEQSNLDHPFYPNVHMGKISFPS